MTAGSQTFDNSIERTRANLLGPGRSRRLTHKINISADQVFRQSTMIILLVTA
jgi:hypothetical protein